MIFDKESEFYSEIITSVTVTMAEATISWFFSGKKQNIITSSVRIPVYADGIYDCTKSIQAAVDLGSAYFPSGEYGCTTDIKLSSNNMIKGDK